MPRTKRTQKLDTPSARSRLAIGQTYWATITPGRSIGYRKGKRGGVWLAKLAFGGVRKESKLGSADDVMMADGSMILSHVQAQEKARAWFSKVAAGEADNPITVGEVMAGYLADFSGKSLVTTTKAVNAHILPVLGALRLDALTSQRIEKWRNELAASPALLRSARGLPRRHRKKPVGPDATRKRRATANRLLTILKAALNRAFQKGQIPSDTIWRRVRPFQKVDAPVIRYLPVEDCKRLVAACGPDFGRLVSAALFSGLRYGELCRLQVRDLDARAGSILVTISKSGKPRQVMLTEDGVGFFSGLAKGKDGKALMLIRADGKAWGESHQARLLKAACAVAGIEPPVSFHVLRHTYGSLLAMAGAPMAVIAAQLGHSDTRMTEKHYAHLAPSYVASEVRARMPALGITTATGKLHPPRRRDN